MAEEKEDGGRKRHGPQRREWKMTKERTKGTFRLFSIRSPFPFFWGGSPSLPSILLFSFPFSFSFTFPDFPFLPFLPESKDLTSCCTCVSGHDGITPTIFFYLLFLENYSFQSMILFIITL